MMASSKTCKEDNYLGVFPTKRCASAMLLRQSLPYQIHITSVYAV